MKKIWESGRIAAIVALFAIMVMFALPYGRDAYASFANNRTINDSSYMAQYGHWDFVTLPDKMKVNAVHVALLNTGKVLIVAGSGNNQTDFDSGTFKTLLYDPVNGKTKLIYTPTDLFCGGHTFLPDGRLIVAGGTQRYEKLAGVPAASDAPKKEDPYVTHAGGIMTLKNENPNTGDRVILKGTVFIGPNGQRYDTNVSIVYHAATKIVGGQGKIQVTASSTTVWVDAEMAGNVAVTAQPAKYAIQGLVGDDIHNVYGQGDVMTLKKQDFQGTGKTYIFDPASETYIPKADLNVKRWYPTLIARANGNPLAVSGLDGNGQILQGQTEEWNIKYDRWVERTDLVQYFPSYPALFQTANPDVMFYSGSNAGYGPATRGRKPAFWDLSTNSLTTVPGMRDPSLLESSGSGWVGPVQNQTIMVAGGGGVGESPLSTGRIDLIKLNAKQPHYTAGPSLPHGTRYPVLVGLPDDTTLIAGGASDYRGKHLSDNRTAVIYHPDTNSLTKAADPLVGRDYHSEALLLPDGRIITLGSNPLFADANDTELGIFEQRIAIYTPAYLYHGRRPAIASVPARAQRGSTINVTTPDAASIVKARLIHPGSSTHVTDVDSRTVALQLTVAKGALRLTLPQSQALVPQGYYMLFLVNNQGVPSIAKWVYVT